MAENIKDAAPEVVEEKIETTPAEEKVVEETPIVEKEIPNIGYTENGAIGSATTTKSKNDKATKPVVEKVVVATEKVAIFSPQNIYSEEFGKVSIGYNIVSKKAADFWIGKRGIRLATPAEIAAAQEVLED